MAAVDKHDKSLESFSSIDERSVLLEEVELLEAIYINELTVVSDDEGRPCYLKTLLHPATGENVDQQYVCLTLEFVIPTNYPAVIPDIIIKNPRGLADEHINSLRNELHTLAKEREGGQMLYELIEMAKESLTQCNVPHGNCIICLEDFGSTDAFTKTECYHYFHNHCLLRYVKHSVAELRAEKEEAIKNKHMEADEKQVVCPVCREEISDNVASLSSTPLPEEEVQVVKLSDDIVKIQQKMAELFEKQKAKGGIIDVEAEKNKYYLTLSSAPVAPVVSKIEASTGDANSADMLSDEPIAALSGRGRGKSTENYNDTQLERAPGAGKPGAGKRNYRRDGWKNKLAGSNKDREKIIEQHKESRKLESAEGAKCKEPDHVKVDNNVAENNSSDNPVERMTDGKSQPPDSCRRSTTQSDTSRKSSGGRGRGRGHRSDWGRDDFRRNDYQRREYRPGQENQRKRRDDRMDSFEGRQSKESEGQLSARNPKRDREQYQRRENDLTKSNEEIRTVGKAPESQGIVTNGQVVFNHSDKHRQQQYDSYDRRYSSRDSRNLKSHQRNGHRRAPPKFESQGSGPEYRQKPRDYEDFR